MGVLIALVIFSLWLIHLVYSFSNGPVSFSSPLLYVHMLIQAYLYTGLFITAHDAMHGTVSTNKKINKSIGRLALFLFAGMDYNKIIKSHMLHHKHPADAEDPDFNVSSQNFIVWWLKFLFGYMTFIQILIMAAAFNILDIWFDQKIIFAYWILPMFISTLQLFYFGTYQPHRYPHYNELKPHNSRSQRRNHIWAMFSCYFFGYHYEHHDSPGTPWWQLFKLKQRQSPVVHKF